MKKEIKKKPEELVRFENEIKISLTIEKFAKEALRITERANELGTAPLAVLVRCPAVMCRPLSAMRIYDYFCVAGNNLVPAPEKLTVTDPLSPGLPIMIERSDYNIGRSTNTLYLMSILYYVDKTGTVWKCSLTGVGIAAALKNYNYGCTESVPFGIEKLEFSGWRKVKKLETDFYESQVLSSCAANKSVQERTAAALGPYAIKFFEEHGFKMARRRDCVLALLAPELEQLSKAGYAFADEMIDVLASKRYSYTAATMESFNRLVQPGRNLKEIFKTSKAVYSLLKDEVKLKVWDEYRKFDKFGRIQPAAMRRFYESGEWIDDRELSEFQKILGAKYRGKTVFTFESLENYLHRLDQYEAISPIEALPILRDYLQMCKQLEMKPKIDGDSLKREHDIAARLCREKYDERMSEKMEKACEDLSRFNYEEKLFIIRGVKSYDDLLDEAKQQHNCVASYAELISRGKSFIYFLRQKSAPNKSFVTVEIEIAENMPYIRQKYMAFNRPVRNKAATEFLNRWLKVVRNRIADSEIKTA